MKKRAYLSGVGVMGRRHLKGLVRAGFDVFAFDPRASSEEAAAQNLREEGLDGSGVFWGPALEHVRFDVAIFAETADARFRNLCDFLRRASADRYLLEKPLSSDPEEVRAIGSLFEKADISPHQVSVSLPRRTWHYVHQLRQLCEQSSRFELTVNGGALGFGCNSPHYLDLFMFLDPSALPVVRYVRLSRTRIPSGRGEQFWDYGGTFVLETPRAVFFCSLDADSSANPLVTIRGDHFAAWIDDNDATWKLRVREHGSVMPNYRTGADYRTIEDGIAAFVPPDRTTERWARAEVVLPGLHEALAIHDLLDRILQTGGARPPYAFT